MIDVVYTGDIRHDQKIKNENHNLLLREIKKLGEVKVSEFYNGVGEKHFTDCPFNRGGKDAYWHPDNLRRGQGGGVQVWQYLNAIRLTNNPYVIRLRNDNWFTESSVKVIIKELKQILNGENDLSYFGSNWLEGNMGVEYQVMTKIKGVEDFVIAAKREALNSYDNVIAKLKSIGVNHLRSGNKCFEFISNSKKRHKVLCRIYLTRQTYENYPSDKQVCYDYLISYCTTRDGITKMIPALKWFENYEPWKNINYHKRNLVPLKNGYTLKVDKMERLIRSK
tara:strand:- start:542 stop:1381 length:840 start_codon:yes stop_codon:yes gene_type:complete